MTTIRKDAALMNRAYAFFDVKAFDDALRTFSGMATTPTPDRVGDIIEPLGAKFTNPIPLLWQHDATQPVGTATFAKPTKAGIPFTAKIATIENPIGLRSRLEEAWESIKAGLVRGVSIGFRGLEYAYMETGGIRFTETEVLELSIVTIPANADATIQNIKQFDSKRPAEHRIVRLTPPGETGKRVVRLSSP